METEFYNTLEEYSEVRKRKAELEALLKEVEVERRRLEATLIEQWEGLPDERRDTTTRAGKTGKVTFVPMRSWQVVDRELFDAWVGDTGVSRDTFYKLNPNSVGRYCREASETNGNIPLGVEDNAFIQVRYTKGQ
jgi:DNA gyrase/topoisomerase IV subunit A